MSALEAAALSCLCTIEVVAHAEGISPAARLRPSHAQEVFLQLRQLIYFASSTHLATQMHLCPTELCKELMAKDHNEGS